MKIPKVTVKYDLNKEAEKFFNFLHHPRFPQHRNSIFRAFPELKKLLGEQKNLTKNKEGDVIKNFVMKFRKKYNDKIKSIIKESEKLLNTKIKKLLTALPLLMDYKWPEKHPGFTIVPTILPFSPFEENAFCFSILGQINNKKGGHNILFVSVHEISHIILYKILETKYIKPFYKIIDRDLLDFLKEVLAPVLMNQKPIFNLLHQKNYIGNPFLQYIFVIKDKKISQVTEFFQKIYEDLKYKNKMDFVEILKIMISLILSMKSGIKQKNKIWQKYGNSIVNYEDALKKYSKPIKIKSPGVFTPRRR